MSAFGDNPIVHRLAGGRFVCDASPEAPCRTYPTCDCEAWSFGEPDEDGHSCEATSKPGQTCWLDGWLTDSPLADTFIDGETVLLDDEEFPDGRITVEWDECVFWEYADGTIPTSRDEDEPSAGPPCSPRRCDGCEICQPDQYASLLTEIDHTTPEEKT